MADYGYDYGSHNLNNNDNTTNTLIVIVILLLISIIICCIFFWTTIVAGFNKKKSAATTGMGASTGLLNTKTDSIVSAIERINTQTTEDINNLS